MYVHSMISGKRIAKNTAKIVPRAHVLARIVRTEAHKDFFRAVNSSIDLSSADNRPRNDGSYAMAVMFCPTAYLASVRMIMVLLRTVRSLECAHAYQAPLHFLRAYV